jgi:hypothetical protein
LNIETQPSSAGERRQGIWAELANLNRLLSLRGPQDQPTRTDVKQRAETIRILYEFEKPRNLDESYQYIQALEILRDVGVDGPRDLPTLLRYGWEAVQFYRRIKDFPRLGRALQALANTCRLGKDDATAKNLTLSAYNVLNEKCDSREVNVACLLHQSIFWILRLTARDMDRATGRRDPKVLRLVELAEQVNTPAIWLETRRELAGYFGVWGEIDRAKEQISKLQAIRKSNPDISAEAPTLLRPSIELLLHMDRPGARDHAVNLIRTTYMNLYRADPNLHYWNVLRRWSRDLRLSLALQQPTYASPILIYLPRDEGGWFQRAGE